MYKLLIVIVVLLNFKLQSNIFKKSFENHSKNDEFNFVIFYYSFIIYIIYVHKYLKIEKLCALYARRVKKT